MVYDCFTFFNEADLCQIRMEILNEVVDKFVIVEGTRTFSNKEKELLFEIDSERFAKFKDKIIYIVVDDWPEYENRYTYAHYQRNCILRGLGDCKDDDIIILTDLDEIPNPEAIRKGIKKLKKNPGVLSFEMYLFYYYLNYFAYSKVFWLSQPKMFTFGEFSKPHKSFSNYTGHNEFNVVTTPDQIRCLVDYFGTLHNGGWHFSTVGSPETIQSFFKALVVSDEIGAVGGHDIDIIKQYVENGRFPRKDDIKMCSVKGTRYLPNYIIENREKYSELFTCLLPCEEIKDFKKIVLLITIRRRITNIYKSLRHTIGRIIGYKSKNIEIIDKRG